MARDDEILRKLGEVAEKLEEAGQAPERLRRRAEAMAADLDAIIDSVRPEIRGFANQMANTHPDYGADIMIDATAEALIGDPRFMTSFPEEARFPQFRSLWAKCRAFNIDDVRGKIRGIIEPTVRASRRRAARPPAPAPVPASRGPTGSGTSRPVPPPTPRRGPGGRGMPPHITCSRCGMSYLASRPTCPDCGTPNPSITAPPSGPDTPSGMGGPASGGSGNASDLRGFVVDAVTKKPIEGAKVYLKEATTYEASTEGSRGFYEIENIPKARYTAVAEKAGYNSEEAAISIEPRYGATPQHFALLPERGTHLKDLGKDYDFTEDEIGDILSLSKSERMKKWEKSGKLAGMDRYQKMALEEKVSEFEGKYEKYKGMHKEKKGTDIIHIRLPELAKKPVVEMGRILGGLISATAGFVISAIIGIPIFTYAFLCFAAYVVIPGEPHYLKSVQKEIEKIRNTYKTQIDRLITEGSEKSMRKAATLAKVMESELEVAKALGEFKGWRNAWKTQASGHAAYALKQFLKIFGAALLLIGVYTSGFPTATIIALAGGFVAYFTFTVGRSIPEEKEKK